MATYTTYLHVPPRYLLATSSLPTYLPTYLLTYSPTYIYLPSTHESAHLAISTSIYIVPLVD